MVARNSNKRSDTELYTLGERMLRSPDNELTVAAKVAAPLARKADRDFADKALVFENDIIMSWLASARIVDDKAHIMYTDTLEGKGTNRQLSRNQLTDRFCWTLYEDLMARAAQHLKLPGAEHVPEVFSKGAEQFLFAVLEKTGVNATSRFRATQNLRQYMARTLRPKLGARA